MEVFNILFESAEILRQKAKEIEKRNIASLKQTQNEIQELLSKVPQPRQHKILYIHDTSNYRYESNFPVDYRIVK